MSDFEVRNIKSLQAEGAAGSARINRRGEVVVVPWHIQLALDGQGYAAGAGSVTTPYTLGNTVIDLTQPEFLLRVPSGYVVIPLSIQVVFEVTGGALADVMATVATGDPGDGTSTVADKLPTTLGKNIGSTPASLARQLVTAALTLSNQTEFWRSGDPLDIDAAAGAKVVHEWSALTHPGVPVIYGPGALTVHQVCATSGTGHIQVVFAEFSASEIRS